MNKTITKVEKNLTEVKSYLKKCQNHIFFIEKTNTYFRISLQDNTFTVHSYNNEIITTKEYNFANILAYTDNAKIYIKYMLFNKGKDIKVISVKKRKNLVF
jgi:hypothetical protein